MTEYRTVLEQTRERFPAPDLPLERVLRRRDRRRRNQRLAASAVGLAIAIFAVLVGTSLIRSSPRRDVPASPQTPVTPRMHNGSIGVFGFTDGVRSLTFDGAGKFVFQCQGDCAQVLSADWSPDGTRLAFIAGCFGGSCGLSLDPYHGVHVVDPVGGTDRLVLPGAYIYTLAWSPDGTHIAYVQGRLLEGVGQQIFVMNADGSEQTPLTPILGDYPESLSWSPDGSRIAYSTRSGTVNVVAEVFVVGLDGSAPSLLVEGSYPAWSPDGTTIAYLVGCEVRMTTPEGGNDISLIDLAVRADAQGCDSATDLEWSPDGTELVAMVDRHAFAATTPSSRAVFVVDADGSKARLFSNWSRWPEYWGLTWQPVP